MDEDNSSNALVMLKNGNTQLNGVLSLSNGTDTLVLPNTKGTNGQILTSDGVGNATWMDTVGDGTGTDDQTLSEVLGQGTDANASTITNLLAINSTHGAKLTETGIWMNASDRNRKTNVQDLDYGLAEIMKLLPVAYDYKSDGSHSIGFIAQQVEKILPELVKGKEGDKSMAYSLLTSVIVKAMQEMQTENVKVKGDNEQVKAVNDEQEMEIDVLQSLVHQLQAENAELQKVQARMAKLESLVSQLVKESPASNQTDKDRK